MAVIPDRVKTALAEYAEAADASIQASQQLYLAEKGYELANQSDEQDTRENAAQFVVRTTLDDMTAQFTLMKKREILRTLVELAKVGMV